MGERIRLAELLGSLSFAGDLGRGQPMGHVLRTTGIAVELARRLGTPAAHLADVYYTALLVHAGCTAGAAEFAAFLAGDELSAQKDFCLCDPNNLGQLFAWMRRNVARDGPLPARALRMLRLITSGEKAFQDIEVGCSEVGSRIAARLGLSAEAQRSLYNICETWNGKGPHGLKGEDIPLPARIVNAAMILEVFFSERGLPAVKEAAAARAGKSFDPAVAAAAVTLGEDSRFWAAFAGQDSWTSVLELEPPPARYAGESALDNFAYALADIVDLKSTARAAHSRRVAETAVRMARRLRLSEEEEKLVWRAALVHDVGLVAVPSLLLEPGARWSETDAERFRLHAHYTERILSRSAWLQPLGAVAGAHHERLDGRGYHRGLAAAQLSVPARIVAVASAYAEAAEAAGQGAGPEHALGRLAGDGLDRDCLAALAAELGASSQQSQRRAWPAGLTDREVEVVRLVARGMSLKQAAEQLVISDHTARHHLESIYGKAGVSSRAGLALFAIENGLLT